VLTEERVQHHFDRYAQRFDAIYRESEGPLSRFIDRVWRGVVLERFDLTLRKLEPLADKAVLDVGCGSGRYCIACAERGATRVVGVDFAPAMIEIADDLSRRDGLRTRCEFRLGPFPEAVPEDSFDVSIAQGVLDYVEDPVRILKAMREKTRSTMILSFPKSAEWRVLVRRVRFLLAGCPLFLYSERRAREILAQAGIDRYEWIPLDRDYIVVARL